MYFAASPFFWAIISMFGLLGATTAVNTKYGKRNPIIGILSAGLFSLGRFILVLPLIPQPRFETSTYTYGIAFVFLILAIVFIFPGLKTRPLSSPYTVSNLKTDGLFGFVRHPFYLGELFLSFSLAMLFGSVIGLFMVPIWWASLTMHIIHEEESLEQDLGPFYLEYKSRVKGRIIPIPPFNKATIQKYPFKNLVFKGGGMKGSAYIGVIEELYDLNLMQQIERVAGSSAGAITATLLSFNLALEETIDLLNTLKFQNIPQLKLETNSKEPEWLPKFIGKEINRLSGDMEGVQRLITKYGWYSSEYFYSWLKTVIAKYCDGNPLATFADFEKLGHKDLYVVATNISKLTIEVFSAKSSPHMPVANAVRMSMSIPLFFEMLQYDGQQLGQGDYYVDGGVLLNYPIYIFDHKDFAKNNIWYRDGINWETLGFYLYTDVNDGAEPEPIQGFRDVITHLMECYDLSLQIADIDNNKLNLQRTVVINTLDVQLTDFQLTSDDEKYQAIVEEGRKSFTRFIQNYRNPTNKTI
jgi:NTE family protein